MPEQSHSILESLWMWFAATGIGATFLGWFGKRQIRRIDMLDDKKANKVDVERSFTLVRDELKDYGDTSQRSLSYISRRVDDILKMMAEKK